MSVLLAWGRQDQGSPDRLPQGACGLQGEKGQQVEMLVPGGTRSFLSNQCGKLVIFSRPERQEERERFLKKGKIWSQRSRNLKSSRRDKTIIKQNKRVLSNLVYAVLPPPLSSSAEMGHFVFFMHLDFSFNNTF